MEQLLKIATVPISYKLVVNNARLERHNGNAAIQISRERGGLHIQSQPIKVKLDTYDARNSVVPTTKTAIYQAAQKGKNTVYEVSARYAQEGRLMLNTQIGEGAQTIDQILASRTAMPTGQFELAFTPKAGPNIQWEGPSLAMEYQMDKLNFDLRIDKGSVEYIPGSVEMQIEQYPEVNIEYVGDPIYVPPSVAARFGGEYVDVRA